MRVRANPLDPPPAVSIAGREPTRGLWVTAILLPYKMAVSMRKDTDHAHAGTRSIPCVPYYHSIVARTNFYCERIFWHQWRSYTRAYPARACVKIFRCLGKNDVESQGQRSLLAFIATWSEHTGMTERMVFVAENGNVSLYSIIMLAFR